MTKLRRVKDLRRVGLVERLHFKELVSVEDSEDNYEERVRKFDELVHEGRPSWANAYYHCGTYDLHGVSVNCYSRPEELIIYLKIPKRSCKVF